MVDKDQTIIKGNGTWQAALELGWEHIWIHRTGLIGKEAELFAIADNRIAELSEWDYEQLSMAIQSDEGMADNLLKLGWSEQLLAPLRIAQWKPDEIEKLELPPPPPHLEPCVFLDLNDKDMEKIAAGVAYWRSTHPSAAEQSDAHCVGAICAWYAKQPKALS